MSAPARVLVVDWLGRGGIAQTSESWIDALREGGAEVAVVTRGERELAASEPGAIVSADHRPAIRAHLSLVRLAVRTIRSWQPTAVVIQNYLVPLVEEPVHRAARSVGARVVFVVHNRVHHARRNGTTLGLDGQIRRADAVVVHSAAVADAVAADVDRSVTVVPHPVYAGMADGGGRSVLPRDAGCAQAIQVGVVDREYKGVATTVELARRGVSGWSFGVAGSGAPTGPGFASVDRFLAKDEIVATVRDADVVLLPYLRASQSGVVVLAQMLGTVVVASAVDGLAEQIDDGVTGVLVAPGASVDAWVEALRSLEDADRRSRITEAATDRLRAADQRFRAAVREIAGAA